jgi:large subunit ribosomal protein L23
MTPQDIIKRPIITERATSASEKLGQVTFEVSREANKNQIRDAVEFLYPNVKVRSVRTLRVPGKLKRRGTSIGRRSAWKKAVVALRKGDVIDFFASE